MDRPHSELCTDLLNSLRLSCPFRLPASAFAPSFWLLGASLLHPWERWDLTALTGYRDWHDWLRCGYLKCGIPVMGHL